MREGPRFGAFFLSMSALFHSVADSLWGRPCNAIHIQPHLTPDAQEALAAVQRELAAHWPGALHCAPPAAIHVTIYPVVRVPGRFDREAYWRMIESPTRALLRDVAAGAGAISLRFTGIRVMPAGIIAVAEDASGLIETIRRRVVEALPPPPGHEPIRYDLVHVTLARFASSEPVPAAAVDQVEALPVSVEARVDRLKLTRETLFPCLIVEEISSVLLIAGRSLS
jgi:2'-5' RNA ligase